MPGPLSATLLRVNPGCAAAWQKIISGYDGEMELSETLPPELERFWRTDDGMTAIERAEAYGIDISLLVDNLRLTPAERVRQNDRMLNEADALRKAYLASRERLEPHHATTGGISR
jgi:hypothetical protein